VHDALDVAQGHSAAGAEEIEQAVVTFKPLAEAIKCELGKLVVPVNLTSMLANLSASLLI
jgi:hypothetical protein